MNPSAVEAVRNIASTGDTDADALKRRRAFRQLVLGQAQIICATACLYFLLTSGLSPLTYISAVIAFLFMLLSLTFKFKPRTRK